MPTPKRLIEVDLPIKRISGHARHEKSVRHGHISTLHVWWARRPLAACRAVLCAALWPDPADPNCSTAFREIAAREILDFADKLVHGGPNNKLRQTSSEDTLRRFGTLVLRVPKFDLTQNTHLIELRAALLDFIADFADWKNSSNFDYLRTARALTQAAHEAAGGERGTLPLVFDPFAGGGAIPVEALRIGADAFASDLNPVAVLLNKVVLEFIPRYGLGLAEAVRKWGAWVKEQAEIELAKFYPPDSDGAKPIAYLWARTITCEGPGCGCEVPLMRSLWLAKKAKNSVALRIVPRLDEKRIDLEIIRDARVVDVKGGTVQRGSVTCPCCGYTTRVERVRVQLKARNGGASDARLLAVVTTHQNTQGRFYRLPEPHDFAAISAAMIEIERLKAAHVGPFSLVPDELFPSTGLRRVQVPNYGISAIGDMFTPRQALAIVTFARCIRKAKALIDPTLRTAVYTVLNLVLDKQIDLGNSLNRWEPVAQCPRQLFARQSVPIVWDFAEGVPPGESSGSWQVLYKSTAKLLGDQTGLWLTGHAEMASALQHPLSDDAAEVLFTDPPYYDSVVYAHTADVFYPWLKRQLIDDFPELFSTHLTPKEDEIVVDPPHKLSPSKKDALFFETKMTEALTEARRVTKPDGIGTIVFAHSSTEGWEAMLGAIITAGWIITASWPLETEMATRVIAQDKAVLASSIHLVCRPREHENGQPTSETGDWRDVLSELPLRIRSWLPRLEQEGIVGADAIFACLGPAMEIFSRYSRVEKPSGDAVSLREYLEQVWAAVSREAMGMIFKDADSTGFEEDARLTAMWLWTLNSGGENGVDTSVDEDDFSDSDEDTNTAKPVAGFSLEYDTARKISQGIGAYLERLGNLVEVRSSKARLLPVAERAGFLFGKGALNAPAAKKSSRQMSFFDLMDANEAEQWRVEERASDVSAGRTTLDRLHQAMLLHASGQTDALRRFLIEDGVGREPRFWRLQEALLRLYPQKTDERRWLEGLSNRRKSLGL